MAKNENEDQKLVLYLARMFDLNERIVQDLTDAESYGIEKVKNVGQTGALLKVTGKRKDSTTFSHEVWWKQK